MDALILGWDLISTTKAQTWAFVQNDLGERTFICLFAHSLNHFLFFSCDKNIYQVLQSYVWMALEILGSTLPL